MALGGHRSNITIVANAVSENDIACCSVSKWICC